MRYGYIAAPHSIYADIQKLEPGHMLTVNADGQVSIHCYWNIKMVNRAAVDTVDEETAVSQFEPLLKDAVRRCMISDVPLGAFLSGGVDSSTVVALMQSVASRAVQTFTIGFADARYNEAEHAKAVAVYLGTDHTELYVEDHDLLETIPKLSNCFDEPFGDTSQIPTYLLAALTRRHVTVALSGDGGDEVFGGYTRYFHALRVWRALGWLPRGLARFMGRAVGSLSNFLDQGAAEIPLVPQSLRVRDRLQKVTELLSVGGSMSLYRQLVSYWPRPEACVLGGREPRGLLWDESIADEFPSLFDQMRLIDLATYLPDHCLTKVDRTTMAVGLEARVPLLDHRIVSLVWSLPASTYSDGNRSKWLLRKVLYKYVPRELIERPKWGFIPPLGDWLRGPLRDWAESLLSESRLRQECLLDPVPIRARWRDHMSGKADWSTLLWDVLAFECWLEGQGQRSSASANRFSADAREYLIP
jgi:asparagine synthase (glutamine-hydrolysing)